VFPSRQPLTELRFRQLALGEHAQTVHVGGVHLP
jgi:hypothetical protein